MDPLVFRRQLSLELLQNQLALFFEAETIDPYHMPPDFPLSTSNHDRAKIYVPSTHTSKHTMLAGTPGMPRVQSGGW